MNEFFCGECPIKPRTTTIVLALLFAAVAFAACRPAATGPRNVAPTTTPTPISTPLPPVATQPPPGSDDNPIRLLVNPALTVASARSAANRLTGELTERTGLAVVVETVTSDAEALAALCDSVGGAVNVAWVDGLTVLAAQAQGCGEAVLMAERGVGRRAQTGDSVRLVTQAEDGAASVAALGNDASFCRLGYDDLATWLVPSIMLQTAGVPPSEIGAVTDYEDLNAVLAAVAGGECDAAGVPASALAAANAATRNALISLAESASIPYSVLVYPPEMPLGARTALENALTDLMADADAGEPLRDLLSADALEQVDASDFDDLNDFIAAAGLDLARLGQ